MEVSFMAQEIGLTKFLDTEGVFDNVPTETIIWIVTNHGIEYTICK